MKSNELQSWLWAGQIETAVGPFAVACDEKGAVVATAFGDCGALAGRLEAGVILKRGAEADRVLVPVVEQLQEYFSGRRRDFEVAIAPRGSAFQSRVWQALREIPVGETRSYGELAKALGSSARAVGRANATNPICVIVPCHRVIGASGALTGFAFGVAIKQWLLELEHGEENGLDETIEEELVLV